MQIADLDGFSVHYAESGEPGGAPIVLANSLGTDLRLWDKLVPLLPRGLRVIRYDMRGHGLTDATPAPYKMGTLVGDAERLMDHLGVKGAVFVGLSIGGMIAQGLAVKRPDLVRAVVLSNTAARIGTPEMWADRVARIEAQGIEAVADSILERWFAAGFRAGTEFAAWRNMLLRQPLPGYLGCSQAIAGTDFWNVSPGITQPVLGIAGGEDGSTPADLVRETVEQMHDHRFHVIPGAGHLPCVEKPGDYAEALTRFLKEVGHV